MWGIRRQQVDEVNHSKHFSHVISFIFFLYVNSILFFFPSFPNIRNFSPLQRIYSSPSEALPSVADLIFQHKFLPVSGHCVPISYSHYLQIRFNLISPSFPWSSSIPCFFPVLAVTICFGILSIFIISICPHQRSYYLSLYHHFVWYFDDDKRIFSSSSPRLFPE